MVIKSVFVLVLIAAANVVKDYLESQHESVHGGFEIAKIKMKLQERELELKYKTERKPREFEIKKLELGTRKLQIKHGQNSGDLVSRHFYASRNIRLVPLFNENCNKYELAKRCFL